METFLEWLNQRDPEYLFESAFAEQNSELIEETFGRRMGGRPLFAPRPSRQVVTRRQSYAPVNRGYTQGYTSGNTQANRTIPNMDPVTGKVLPDDVSPSTVDQADNRREPQQLDISALLNSNIPVQQKQNRIKQFIKDDLQGDLRNANQDDIDSIVFAISDGILDDDIIPYDVASDLKNTANKFRVREELEKLTKTPLQRQLGKLINRADAATKQFPPR